MIKKEYWVYQQRALCRHDNLPKWLDDDNGLTTTALPKAPGILPGWVLLLCDCCVLLQRLPLKLIWISPKTKAEALKHCVNAWR